MGVMIYALVIYQSRARAIRKRTGAPYDDRLGPVSVVVWPGRVNERVADRVHDGCDGITNH
jgi:hypothetical protein